MIGGDVLTVEGRRTSIHGDGRATGNARGGLGIVHVDTGLQHGVGHGSVHRAGIEHLQTERGGHAARDRRLSGTGRSVDRDDPRVEPSFPCVHGDRTEARS